MDTNELQNDFCEWLLISSFFENLKENLLSGGFLICFDFPNNHAFIIQNTAQSFTVAIYHKDREPKHISIAIGSDNSAYDTLAVHEYQKIIIPGQRKSTISLMVLGKIFRIRVAMLISKPRF